jgi:hypothetical protein
LIISSIQAVMLHHLIGLFYLLVADQPSLEVCFHFHRQGHQWSSANLSPPTL